MNYNLRELIQSHNLEHNETSFTKEDIGKVIKSMPPDKAPKPDRFSGLFLTKCWDIIKEDIYYLCFEYFKGEVNL
jgi:hypothetical protein